MNIWDFLDRNSGGIFILAIILMAYSFGSCGSQEGCRMRFGNVPNVAAQDGGAP